MPVSLRLRTVVISAAVVAALGSGAATASAATTTHSQPATQATCPDGWCGLWGTVEAQPFVNVRWGPSESYTIKGHALYRDSVEVHCYKTGQWESGRGLSNPYWDLIVDTNTGVSGYAADVWIETGGNITSQVRACP